MVIAGGLMFLIMNFGVAGKLRKELETTKYEAALLLKDAEAYFEDEDFNNSKETLNTLFEKRPGSDEAMEGKKLYAQMETLEKERDAKWEAAVGDIREEWAVAMAAQLREDFMEKGEQLEKNMDNVLNSEWEKMKDKIRAEWEM
jgi:hypothetical protein